MRLLQRAIIALLSFAVIGLVPFAGSTATAAEDGTYTRSGMAPSGEAEPRDTARRERRGLTFKFRCRRSCNRFTFVGWVQGKKTWIVLQRKRNGAFRKVRAMRTNFRGKYEFKNPYLNRPGRYRLMVPGNKRFYKRYSDVIRVNRQ